MEFGGVKTGGLSLTSETSMLRMTVEDMAGEPLSKACTDREYRDTCRESSTIRMYQALGHVKGRTRSAATLSGPDVSCGP